MEFATLWLPIIGGLLLGALCVSAWYGGNKTLASWSGFAGIVCFLLLGALQIQEAVWQFERPPDDAENRPWIGLESKIIDQLAFQGSGAHLRLQVAMNNHGRSPATNVIAITRMFVDEKQPFQASEIILRRTTNFAPGSGGLSIFPNRTATENHTVGVNDLDGAEIAPLFLLVAVKYRSASNPDVRLTANLYALSRRGAGGASFVIKRSDGPVAINDLILLPLGSHAD